MATKPTTPAKEDVSKVADSAGTDSGAAVKDAPKVDGLAAYYEQFGPELSGETVRADDYKTPLHIDNQPTDKALLWGTEDERHSPRLARWMFYTPAMLRHDKETFGTRLHHACREAGDKIKMHEMVLMFQPIEIRNAARKAAYDESQRRLQVGQLKTADRNTRVGSALVDSRDEGVPNPKVIYETKEGSLSSS